MKKLVLDMPRMFADHHVLKIREILTGIDGVEDVLASSAWRQIMISYDSAKAKPNAIEKALADAGYTTAEGTPVLVEADPIKRDPKWGELGVRETKTDPADL
jgi:copper chaperone CopZ